LSAHFRQYAPRQAVVCPHAETQIGLIPNADIEVSPFCRAGQDEFSEFVCCRGAR